MQVLTSKHVSKVLKVTYISITVHNTPLSAVKQNVASKHLNFSSENVYFNFSAIHTIRIVSKVIFGFQINPTQKYHL